MDVIRTVAEMQQTAEKVRCAGERIALVPTMGALHDGHLALVEEARRHADRVTVSIFVNPTQFAPGEDYEKYPRTPEPDLQTLRESEKVDFVFMPVVEDIYPPGAATSVSVRELDRHLCGPFRARHFEGVATVVARLFTACRPHVAVFGRKDIQQFVILERMARDLGFGVEVIGVETVREADGLAMSSRNRYLSTVARAEASVIWKALSEARDAVINGESDVSRLEEGIRLAIEAAPLADLQYAQIVDAETLQPIDTIHPGRPAIAAVAVYFDGARLIDNVVLVRN